MSKLSSDAALKRREFIGASAIAGLAAGTSLTATASSGAPPEKFATIKPLKPAPDFQATAVAPPPLAALVYNKAAYGPRPGDIDAFNALGNPGSTDLDKLNLWLNAQLDPGLTDTEVDTRLSDLLASTVPADQAAYDTVNKTAEQLWVDHARNTDYATRIRPLSQMERLTVLRAAYSQWQLREVMYDFWINHFNVYGREFPTYGMIPNYDKELRAHIFGNFGNMLKANARTATMLYYLDNYANTWPNPNENYAREVLELHTLGAVENYYGPVDPATVGNNSKGQRAGYTEIDVFEFAKALTGWAVSDGTDASPDTGAFQFRPIRHYDDWAEAPITVMDMVLTETNGEADVTDILDYLAGHFGTARYIAWKLCTRLIGDDPDESIVNSTALEFYNRSADSDQLKEVYRHILTSSQFRDTWGDKVSRPVETLVRAWRASGVDLTFRIEDSASNSIWYSLDDTSHYPFGYAPPTGFPDERIMWQGSGPLIMSWRVVTYMLRRSEIVNQAEQTNAYFTLEVDRHANNIVPWWISRALGYELSTPARDRIIQYVTDILAQLDGGFTGDYAAEPIGTFTDTVTVLNVDGTAKNSTYQKIIRGVVGLILMSPEAMRR